MLIWAAAFFVAAQAASAAVPNVWPESTLRSRVPPPIGARELSLAAEMKAHIGGLYPQFAYGSAGSLRSFDQRVVVFYRLNSAQPSRRAFVARSLSTFGTHPMQPLWADSRTCPAVLERLESLDHLPVKIAAPMGLLERRPLIGVIDGVSIAMRTDAVTEDGTRVFAEISGSAQALTAWAEATNRAIESCLSLDIPPDVPLSRTD